jgi:hypothetical protein
MNFCSCSNNSDKKASMHFEKNKNISKLTARLSTPQKIVSPAFLRYKKKFDSLSQTANFHVDSVDNFLRLQSVQADVQTEKLTSELRNSINVSTQSLSLPVRDIDDIEICRQGIDWIFCCGGNNPPTRVSGYFFPVKYFGYSVIRGPYSARTCGNLAVVHAVLGMRDYGLTWIQAAQSHNPECVAAFGRNADFALNYAIANHAADAFAELGIPYLDAAKSGVQVLKGMAENYHPDVVPPDEKRAIEAKRNIDMRVEPGGGKRN